MSLGWRDAALLFARVLIALLFLGGAVQKVLNPADAMSLLAGFALPVALIWPAMLFNAAAGVALILGQWTTPVALLLAAYCGVTSVFHWLPDDPWQMTIFVKNWAIAGGCLALAVAGPGRFSVGRAVG
ncbi:DoxX family protein [Flavimaricola marinus]|uniref:Inner membrane protein YqjF n=1 Tax=Flavimaricola marinus TaxID=1819565 RepID=A0A238LEE8_9RHOB|nr:DoxX family protein [Flavimaricola marinus]SMY07933.1 Inner membrane protein YqjF [Flavimaricola marinus]